MSEHRYRIRNAWARWKPQIQIKECQDEERRGAILGDMRHAFFAGAATAAIHGLEVIASGQRVTQEHIRADWHMYRMATIPMDAEAEQVDALQTAWSHGYSNSVLAMRDGTNPRDVIAEVGAVAVASIPVPPPTVN